jgi:hypothetical protein
MNFHGKKSWSYRDSNSDPSSPVVEAVASHYSDYAVLAPYGRWLFNIGLAWGKLQNCLQ